MKKNPIDKIHPIGGAKNENQARIIKTTTQSYKEKVFLQHMRNKKNYNKKRVRKNSQISLPQDGKRTWLLMSLKSRGLFF